ncbi:MAG: helix-turn-helix transcriptional regulator [Thermoleophilia bacterium]
MTVPGTPGQVGATRQAILDALGRSPDGLTAVELAADLGIHPNAVRKQLRALAAAGEVGASREAPSGRGRPAARFRVSDTRRGALGAKWLSDMLVALVNQAQPAPGLVEEFGRIQAPALAGGRSGRRALLDVLMGAGFAPQDVTPARAAGVGSVEIVLRRCPFREAVAAPGGDLICELHRGLSRGLVECNRGASLTAFEVHPPESGACRLVAEGVAD